MAADFDDEVASSYKGKQRFNRKGIPLLPPEEVRPGTVCDKLQ